MDSINISTQSWLTKQLEKWFATSNGYSRLRSARFSQACQSFSLKFTDDSDDYEIQLMENQKKLSLIKSRSSAKEECEVNDELNNNLSMDKDIMNLPGTKFGLPCTQEELMAFERRHREYMYELQRKRDSLDECRQELAEAKLKNQDLERQLLNESRKNEHDNLQYKLLINATQTLEEERQSMRTELNKLKTQAEIFTAERDILKEQTRNLSVDNIKLKRQVEDLESRHRCHEQFQNDLLGYQMRMKKLVAGIRNSMNVLGGTRDKLHKCRKTLDKYTDLLLTAKHMEAERDMAIKRLRDLENELIRKSAELTELKLLLANSPILKVQKQPTLQIEPIIQHLEEQLSKEMKHSTELAVALAASSKAQRILQEKNEKQDATLEELKKQLSEMEAKKSMVDLLKTDIPDAEKCFKQVEQ